MPSWPFIKTKSQRIAELEELCDFQRATLINQGRRIGELESNVEQLAAAVAKLIGDEDARAAFAVERLDDLETATGNAARSIGDTRDRLAKLQAAQALVEKAVIKIAGSVETLEQRVNDAEESNGFQDGVQATQGKRLEALERVLTSQYMPSPDVAGFTAGAISDLLEGKGDRDAIAALAARLRRAEYEGR